MRGSPHPSKPQSPPPTPPPKPRSEAIEQGGGIVEKVMKQWDIWAPPNSAFWAPPPPGPSASAHRGAGGAGGPFFGGSAWQ
jgi:hypothetical protein